MAYGGVPEETFLLEQLFTSGYQDKLQPDEVPPGSAIPESFNFILGDDGKWVTRPGTEYLGTPADEDFIQGGCVSAARLRRRDGVEIPIINHGTQTRYLNPDQSRQSPFTSPGTPDWVLFQTGFTLGSVFGFAVNDRNSDNLNRLVMSNARENYRIWSGAMDFLSSWTGTTVTTASSTGVASGLFTATGTIIISNKNKAREFTYTGITASTFTGVTPDPTTGFGDGELFEGGEGITQKPIEYASAPKGNVLLCTNNARILVANVLNTTTNEPGGGQVYGSKVDDPTDFTFGSPRSPGDGFIASYAQGGGTVTGLSQKETVNYVFKPETIQTLDFTQDGNDFIIQQPLTSYDERTSSDEGSVGALAVFRGENTIIFVTPTNVINSVNRVQQVDYVQTIPISDPIKNFTDNCVFDTETAGIGYRGRLIVSCKLNSNSTTNDLVLVYNLRYQSWETPLTGVAIGSWFIYQQKLYGCLANSPNVVKMFTGTTDFKENTPIPRSGVQPESSPGIPIQCKLTLPDMNYGERSKRKDYDQYYIEGEMDESGDVTFSFSYDQGAEVRQGNLFGQNGEFFFTDDSDGEFGLDPFGLETFGPEVIEGTDTSKRRFRLILTTKERPFYTLSFSMDTASYFKLLAAGPNARLTKWQKPKTTYRQMAVLPLPTTPTGALLLEDGEAILLENGEEIGLES